MKPVHKQYADANAFRMALENRLNQADLNITRLRKQISFERFLARMVEVAPTGWVLKGAFALDIRYGDRTRTTKDLDLAMKQPEEEGDQIVGKAAGFELHDYFSFRIRRKRVKNLKIENPARTYAITSMVAGRTFEDFAIDISYNETPLSKPDDLRTLGHSSFAGVEAPTVPVVSIEQHLAEKVSAYNRDRDGRRSTRPKDLVDIVLISEDTHDLDALIVIDAVQTTLGVLDESIPSSLPSPPTDWVRRYSALAKETGVTPDLDQAYKLAAEFLDPILSGVASGVWSPKDRKWK